MCLLLIAHQVHRQYKLIALANRDEFYHRPTAPACWWPDNKNLLAGKDLKKGGTWLGITRQGKFAAITNFRDPKKINQNAPSRGLIVKDFLSSNITAEDFLVQLHDAGEQYNGFNLVIGEAERIYYFSNRSKNVLVLKPGIYGVSNNLLDDDWPKVRKGKQILTDIVRKSDKFALEESFLLLKDSTLAPDDQLPDTGLGQKLEKILSAIFIKTPDYGTRSSTILTIDKNNQVQFYEHSFVPTAKKEFNFTIDISQ